MFLEFDLLTLEVTQICEEICRDLLSNYRDLDVINEVPVAPHNGHLELCVLQKIKPV